MRVLITTLLCLLLLGCGPQGGEEIFRGESHQEINAGDARTLRIIESGGGLVRETMENVDALRESGRAVVIDGTCLSSCTMYVAVACYTDRAVLGFHSPNVVDRDVTGERERRALAVARMKMTGEYPEGIQRWLRGETVVPGGETALFNRGWTYLDSDDLDLLIPERRCSE